MMKKIFQSACLFLYLFMGVSDLAFSQRDSIFQLPAIQIPGQQNPFDHPVVHQVPVIPLPARYEMLEGTFRITGNTPILVEDSQFSSSARYLQQEMLKKTGKAFSIFEKSRIPAIVFSRSRREGPAGSYELQISAYEIRISANSDEGMFYGVNSLLQLVRQADTGKGDIILNAWQISDEPRFEWRGLMLDESRHFFGKQTVKFILDWMAFYKLNRFHWHLTDEPAWRLEILKYPKLALVGGIGSYSNPFAPAQYYTHDDIREIVAYARERHIVVIPEIDMPGHAAAANRAYPEHSGGGSEKYPDFTFNPGRNETYTYLTDILKETNVLFPSGMIHLGGDEVHFGNENWNKDRDVQRLMKDRRLNDLKAVEYHFMRRMSDSLAKINSKVLLWDEAASGNLSPANTQIFWWRHDKPDQFRLAAGKGFPIVLTPRLPLYFDFVQDTTHKVGRRWEGQYNPLERVYDLAVDSLIAMVKPGTVKGIQAAVWTERISTRNKLEHMLFPRIAALAESAWTPKEQKSYLPFTARLNQHFDLYRRERIYFYNPTDPGEHPEPASKF